MFVLLKIFLATPIFHNRKAETSTFRIQVSPSLSDPENGFSFYPQAPYKHLQPLRNPSSAKP